MLMQNEVQLGSLGFDTSQNLEPGGYKNLSSKFGSYQVWCVPYGMFFPLFLLLLPIE